MKIEVIMNFLVYIFNITCFLSAFGMTIYWCFKYWKDEDLCVIDYKHFDDTHDDVYPVLSLCFANVIIDSKLKEYNVSFTAQMYENYLRGDAYYIGMEFVDFEEVSLHLKDFILGDNIWYKNGSNIGHTTPNYTPYITYSGFFNHLILNKCFGIKTNDKFIYQRFLGFNSSIFPNKNRPDHFFSVHIHMKGQFVLSENTRKDTWPAGKSITTMRFNLNQMEILKRRNKRKETCISNHFNYDEETLREHLEKIECRTPYQTTQRHLPICQAKEDMKAADYFNALKIKACTSLEFVTYRYEETNLIFKIIQSPFWVGMKLPRTFKEILMVKAVDIQTVIGNAGGYVGLFLGNNKT